MNKHRYTETFSPFGLDYVPVGGGLHYLKRMQTTFSCINQISGAVLDVGCGKGKHCHELIVRGAELYIGVDISKANLDIAKTNTGACNKGDFICCDARTLPFASETFDLVLCTETLEHIEDEESPVKEISRILKRGALCVFSVPSTNLWGSASLLVASKLGRLRDKPYRDQSHCREYGKWGFGNKLTKLQHLRWLLMNNGLAVITQKASWVLGPLPPGGYFKSVLCQPHRHVRMVKFLAFIDSTLAKLLKNLGLYTIIAASKLQISLA